MSWQKWYEVPLPPIFSSMLFYKIVTLFYKLVLNFLQKLCMCFTFYKMVAMFVFYGECYFIKLCLKFIKWCIYFIKCLLYFSKSELSCIRGWLMIYRMCCVRLLRCCTYFCALFLFLLLFYPKSCSVFLTGAVFSLKMVHCILQRGTYGAKNFIYSAVWEQISRGYLLVNP